MQIMLQTVIHTYSKLQTTSNETMCSVPIYIYYTMFATHVANTTKEKQSR
jgi:hypothetical protein